MSEECLLNRVPGDQDLSPSCGIWGWTARNQAGLFFEVRPQFSTRIFGRLKKALGAPRHQNGQKEGTPGTK